MYMCVLPLLCLNVIEEVITHIGLAVLQLVQYNAEKV